MERKAEAMEKYMIREAAKQIGVEPPVLRYWEKELFLNIPKNEMGHRYFTAQEIALLRQIKYLKDQGFHLKSIRLLKDNVPKVAQMEVAKLHSLRDRLNSQLMAEISENAEAGQAVETWKEREHLEKIEKGEKKTTVFPVKGTKTGAPAGKIVGTKLTMIALEEEKEKVHTGEEKEEKETTGNAQLLELELAEPKPEEGQRPFNVVQGGRTGMEKGVTVSKPKISDGQVAGTDMDGRMDQFRMIMSDIIGEALRENNRELARDVGTNVSERVIKEMDFMMRSQQEEEEKRYRKLDETIRSCQRSRQEAAAAQEGAKKKKRRFFSIRKSEKEG